MGHRDDLVFGNICGLTDDRMPRQIVRRGGDDATNFAKPDRDEVGIRKMRDAQRDVDAFVDQVDRPVEQIEPHRYHRILVHEGVEHRPQNVFAGNDRRGKRERAARRRAFAAGNNVGFLEIDQHAAAGGDIAFAGFAQLERAGGAMKQFGADMLFEKGDRAAHGRGRPAEPPSRARETALVDRRHKHLHRVDAIHLCFSNWGTLTGP